MIGPSEEFREELERQRERFLDEVAEVRPRLHRYCARMLGSVLDGEDIEHALRHAVTLLPPKERASLLLKDVLGFSLRETADIVDSTEGGVKAALSRGRRKLADADRDATVPARDLESAQRSLLEKYAQRFTARDWKGLVQLLRADARLEVLGKYDARGPEAFTSRYCFNYSRFDFEWRFRVTELEGEPVLAVDKRNGDAWSLMSLVRVAGDGSRVTHVRDYLHVPPYLLADVDGCI